ncbi:MAG: hypothetical protein M1820_010764 [Bogoriella megaspora]|nr:MAG: hypothetical protein M1820_010764 [Bogoriella megaspora]
MLLQRSQTSRVKKCALILSNSVFDKVPVEVLDLIAENLPPESVFALSYSCKYLYCKLYDKWLAHPKWTRQERLNILRHNFEHKLPNHILCPSCVRFHPRRKRLLYLSPSTASNVDSIITVFGPNKDEALHASPKTNWPGLPCRINMFSAPLFKRRSQLNRMRRYDLRWWMFDLVMRAHRHGCTYGVPVEALNIERIWWQYQPWFDWRFSRNNWHLQTKAVIYGDRLLIRVQLILPMRHVYDLRSNQCCRLSSALTYEECNMPACQHHVVDETIRSLADELINSGIPDEDAVNHEGTVRRCQWCPSEYSVDRWHLDDFQKLQKGSSPPFPKTAADAVVVVNRYIDFGDGMPGSLEWKALTDATPRAFNDRIYTMDAKLKSIRSRFCKGLGIAYNEDEVVDTID